MKSNNLLKITGLHVSVGDKEILHGVDLTVNSDETHVLMVLTAQVNLRWVML